MVTDRRKRMIGNGKKERTEGRQREGNGRGKKGNERGSWRRR